MPDMSKKYEVSDAPEKVRPCCQPAACGVLTAGAIQPAQTMAQTASSRRKVLVMSCPEFGTIDPYRASAITGAYVGAFFNKHLTRGTVEHLMDGPSNDYPEVTIQLHDAEE